MLVPKASMDENYLLAAWKDDVRLPGKILSV
jgi:hypothetical protein